MCGCSGLHKSGLPAKSGFPGWFATHYGQPADDGPLGWGRHHWFDNWAAEHKACRETVALIDMSFMSKFLVEGLGAGALLDFLSTVGLFYFECFFVPPLP